MTCSLHAQGVLEQKPIHMAEFEIVLLDLENPGYGDARDPLSTKDTFTRADAALLYRHITASGHSNSGVRG